MILNRDRIGIVIACLFCLFYACNNEEITQQKNQVHRLKVDTFKTYTHPSKLANQYTNFNSVDAINKIAEIENEYFNALANGEFSRYYGTQWRFAMEETSSDSLEISVFQDYLNNLDSCNNKPDSLHCTLYAFEAIKAGLKKSDFERLMVLHKKHYKDHEIAGWSIGYILVKYFDWKAYLVINESSSEYQHCLNAFNKNKKYPVWKQPDIPLERIYTNGVEDTTFQTLLQQHEFGWGFSKQGIHTWVTRFNELKECYWFGAPSTKYQELGFHKPLFLSTPFQEYFDYNSHIIIFPPK